MIKNRLFVDGYHRGDGEPLQFVITRSDGSSMDWTGYTWTFIGRTAVPAGAVTNDSGASFAKTNTDISLSSLTGSRITFTVALAKTDTYSLDVGTDGYVDILCDLQGTKSAVPITVAKITLRVYGDVARA